MNEIRSEAFVSGYCAAVAVAIGTQLPPVHSLWLRLVIAALALTVACIASRKAAKLEKRLWERAERRP